MRPPIQVYSGMIGAAILLALFFRFKERDAEITTEQQVREGSGAQVDRLRDAIAENDAAMADLRHALRERECAHLIEEPPPAYGECIGVETIEWCDLTERQREIFVGMGATGRSCQPEIH